MSNQSAALQADIMAGFEDKKTKEETKASTLQEPEKTQKSLYDEKARQDANVVDSSTSSSKDDIPQKRTQEA